ncbi:MAG: hypothetical protein PHO02_03060 [Candidatus Nanoarchaeia archaeon]|nr:hypothetical protein [Candidatus Nanoarchaeia archaeon]
MNKSKIAMMVLCLAAIVSAFAVSASASGFWISDVTVNDISNAGYNDYISVERGTTLDISVELLTNEALTSECDVKIWAEIGGYEGDEDVRVSSGMFTLRPGIPGTRYQRTLELELPNDLEEGDYKLSIRVVSANEPTVETQLNLNVIPSRHLLEIKGVVVPTPYVEAGQTATVKVRLQNIGARDENNVKVVAAIDKLKVYDVEWIELVETEIPGDDEEDSETAILYLPIPKDAASGEYELEVGIAYNNERDTQVVRTTINIRGVEAKAEAVEEEEEGAQIPVIETKPVDPSKELTLAFDTMSQHIAIGRETAYKLTISNLASESRDITLSAAGAQLFADIRIDPSTLTIEGGQKADVYVYAKPKSDAELKVSQFTLRVMNGDKLYKELSLSLGVEEPEVKKSFFSLEDDTLKIIFIGLVVILIIVGLLIAFRRVRGEDYPLEPIEERIYY